MNYKDNFHAVRDDRTKLVNHVADLKTENLWLREALEHFIFCRSCEADEDFKYCELGQEYFQKLVLYVHAKKAV